MPGLLSGNLKSKINLNLTPSDFRLCIHIHQTVDVRSLQIRLRTASSHKMNYTACNRKVIRTSWKITQIFTHYRSAQIKSELNFGTFRPAQVKIECNSNTVKPKN
jgi:hypothetical protein